MAFERHFMERALSIAARAVGQPGLEPFGAVVVLDGEIVGEGLNRSQAKLDVTSHGEIEAIRDASQRLGSLDLRGAEIYSSCEPCPLCVAASAISGIGRIYFAASIDQALQVFTEEARSGDDPSPMDVEEVRKLAGSKVGTAGLDAEQHLAALGIEVIRSWARAR
jgi:tRNA(Arg) A34 adenosine deaminase TadA